MSIVYRTVWFGITGAFLLGVPSPSAAEPPPSDTVAAPGPSAPSAPSAKEANGADPAPVTTNSSREAERRAPMASPGPPYAAPAYPYPYSYAYPYRYSIAPTRDSSDETGRYWYGWQTLTSLGVSTAFMFLSFASPSAAEVTVPLSLGGALLGGPIVHFANRNTANGFISLGMNVGASAVGAAIGVGVCLRSCGNTFGGYEFLVGGAIGAGIGVVISNIVDASVFAYGRHKAPLNEAVSPKRRPIVLLPTLDIRRDRASAGAMGTF